MFQPVIPFSGLTGWRFLQQTYDSQFEAFSQSTVLQRDTEYFKDKISEITSAKELVSDRRLLGVALGAFGLQEDIDNRYFVQKILEEGTINVDSLANRFSDTRYREMSEAFGFGPSEFLKVGESNFVTAIIDRFHTNSFEVAAGEQNDSMRVALYAQRELLQIAQSDSSTDAKWFTILGDLPMRQLFEKALSLPSSIGQIDIDQQLAIFKDRAVTVFGSNRFDQFQSEDARQDIITKFIVREQIEGLGGALSSGSIALTLLQT